jgi:hypothetical protein
MILNNDTLNNDTLNNDTLNNDTLNNDTFNNDTLSHSILGTLAESMQCVFYEKTQHYFLHRDYLGQGDDRVNPYYVGKFILYKLTISINNNMNNS